MVVLFHSVYAWEPVDSNLGLFCESLLWLTNQLWIGVPIFFVISGYCISASVDSLLDGKFNFSDYMYRRFKRIYPPYLAMILILTLMSLAEKIAGSNVLTENGVHILPPWWRTNWELFGNFTLTESWRDHVIGSPRRMSMIVAVAWTLCYEEQFYLLMGLIAKFFGRKFFWMAVVAVSLMTIPFFGNAKIQGFFFDGYWLNFALGALVYYVIRYRVSISYIISVAILAGCLSTGYSLDRGGVEGFNRISISLIISSVFSVVLVLQYGLDAWIQKSSVSYILNWFGVRCYSLYLVHFPITNLLSFWIYKHFGFVSPEATVFITLPICLLVSSLAASLFFHLIEKRFLNTKRPPVCQRNSS